MRSVTTEQGLVIGEGARTSLPPRPIKDFYPEPILPRFCVEAGLLLNKILHNNPQIKPVSNNNSKMVNDKAIVSGWFVFEPATSPI